MKKVFKILLFFIFLPFLSLANDKEIRDKIEYLIMPDFRYWTMEGQTERKDFDKMNEEVKEVISNHNFNGVILFAQNVKTTDQTVRLVDELQKASKIPMLISIDQEGGIVTRLGTGTNFPGNMAIGATRSKDYSNKVGAVIAKELKSLGINTNLAPVIDVNNNAKNPVIGLRSFSSNPKLVSELSIPMIKGMQDQGIIAVGKHFPGHGDTAIDTHLGMASVDKDYNTLYNTELVPFKEAINNGLDMIMTAHVQLPQIEKDYFVAQNGEKILYPATLSDDIITGILRNKLGFNGVVITDALGMKAISDNLGPTEAMKLSINAGVDILLMPIGLHSLKDVKALDESIDKLVEAVKKGEISIDRVNESIARINKLKQDRGIVKDNTDVNVKLQNALNVIGSKENRNLERQVSKDAITVIKDSGLKNINKALFIVGDDNQEAVTRFAITRLFSEGKIPFFSYSILKYNDKTDVDVLKLIAKNKYDTIFVYGMMANESSLNPEVYRTKVPNVISQVQGAQKIYVSINKPYDVVAHLNYDIVAISYGFKGMDPTELDGGNKAFGPNIPAALELILTKEKAKGKLPVDLPYIKDGKLTEEIQFRMEK